MVEWQIVRTLLTVSLAKSSLSRCVNKEYFHARSHWFKSSRRFGDVTQGESASFVILVVNFLCSILSDRCVGFGYFKK